MQKNILETVTQNITSQITQPAQVNNADGSGISNKTVKRTIPEAASQGERAKLVFETPFYNENISLEDTCKHCQIVT